MTNHVDGNEFNYNELFESVTDKELDPSVRAKAAASVLIALQTHQMQIESMDIPEEGNPSKDVDKALLNFHTMRQNMWDGLVVTFVSMFSGHDDDPVYTSLTGIETRLSVSIFSALMAIADMSASQVDLLLTILESDKYNHIYTPFIYGAVTEYIFLSHDDAGQDAWSSVDNAFSRIINTYERFACEPNDPDSDMCDDVRAAMVSLIIMWARPESKDFVNKVLNDESESPRVWVQVLNEIRGYPDVYDYTDTIRSFFYSDDPALQNEAAGFLLSYVTNNRADIEEVVNIGGDYATTVVHDILRLVDKLQQNLLRALLKGSRVDPIGDIGFATDFDPSNQNNNQDQAEE